MTVQGKHLQPVIRDDYISNSKLCGYKKECFKFPGHCTGLDECHGICELDFEKNNSGTTK